MMVDNPAEASRNSSSGLLGVMFCACVCVCVCVYQGILDFMFQMPCSQVFVSVHPDLHDVQMEVIA